MWGKQREKRKLYKRKVGGRKREERGRKQREGCRDVVSHSRRKTEKVDCGI